MCGRVVCALSSEELLKIAKAKAINNSMKYRRSYNIGPERYLAGMLKKNTNKKSKEDHMDIIDIKEKLDNDDNEIPTEKKKNNTIESEDKIADEQDNNTIKAGNRKENLQIYQTSLKLIEDKNFIKKPTKEALNLLNRLSEEDNYDPEFKFDLEIMKWGTENSKGIKIINARSETSDLYFKNMRKCVMIVQGYYEWKVITSQSGKETKKPFYFKNADQAKNYLLIAGLYNQNEDSNGFDYKQFIVLTQEATREIEDIHDRMPLIINDELAEVYLNYNYSIDTIKNLAKETPEELEFYGVGDLVNNLVNEGEDNVLPEDQLKYNKNRNLKISNFFTSNKAKGQESKKENNNFEDENKEKIPSKARAKQIKNSVNEVNRKLNKLEGLSKFSKNEDDVSTRYISLIASNPAKRKASPTFSKISNKGKSKKKSKKTPIKDNNLKLFDNLFSKEK